MSRSGADLALLLLSGYRSLVDAASDELAAQGYADFRPVHEFAMRAIAAGADNASELGRRLSVSKQAAAKVTAVLLDRGYVTRDADPHDARRKRLQLTPLGASVLRQGEAVLQARREEWARRIGAAELAALEERLSVLVGDAVVRPGAPAWRGDDPAEAR